jgi:alpha-L-fucosidase 2
LLRRSINLYRHLLFTGDDGKLHLPPTFSPETGNTSDCNFDLALLKWGCTRLIEICRILEIDDPLIPEWERIRNQLADYPVDENGYGWEAINRLPKIISICRT